MLVISQAIATKPMAVWTEAERREPNSQSALAAPHQKRLTPEMFLCLKEHWRREPPLCLHGYELVRMLTPDRLFKYFKEGSNVQVDARVVRVLPQKGNVSMLLSGSCHSTSQSPWCTPLSEPLGSLWILQRIPMVLFFNKSSNRSFYQSSWDFLFFYFCVINSLYGFWKLLL